MASGGDDDKKKPWWKKILLFWTKDVSEKFADWIDGWGVDPLFAGPVFFVVLVWVAAATDPGAIAGVFAMVVALSPVWLPIFLFVGFWVAWMHYIRFLYWFKQKHVLLRIELPPEVTKSPLAMEVFLTSLNQGSGESDFISRIWNGGLRPSWSLEIASNEGRVEFYIHLREFWRNILEAKLYGQFPEAKISVVEDYVNEVKFNTTDYALWGCEFKKSEVAPIRTYIDYQLDKNPDTPEIQVDPISNMLEHMGSIGPGEYLWVQLVIRSHKKNDWYGFPLAKDAWDDGVKEALKKVTKGAIERAKELVSDKAEKEKVGARGSTLLSPGERTKAEAIERSKSKTVFDFGGRGLYIAKSGAFKAANISNLVSIFSPFRYPDFGSIAPTRGLIPFTYPWQDFGDIRQDKVKRNLFFHYKHRAFFGVPYDQPPTFLTTEELATIWHFPSSAIKTPALARVPSRRSDAPPNLPVGPTNLPI